jgi:hypothetical protein
MSTDTASAGGRHENEENDQVFSTDELFRQLQEVEDERKAKEARDKELRMMRKRADMEALITKLSDGGRPPNQGMQTELLELLSPMRQKIQNTNIFRMLTRTIQSSFRQLSDKCDAMNIPEDKDAPNRRELITTLFTMRRVAGSLLVELSTIDPDGGGEYTDDLISRMQALKQSCQQEKRKCVTEKQPHIELVEDRLQFFIDVMTTLEEKYARQYSTRPLRAQETQMTDMLFTLKNL